MLRWRVTDPRSHLVGRLVLWMASYLLLGCGGNVKSDVRSDKVDHDGGRPDAPAAPDAFDASKPDAPPDAVEEDVGPPAPDAGPMPGDAWRQFGHDAKHSGQSRSTVAAHPTVRWKATLDNNDGARMILVDTDGSLVVAGQLGIYAFDPQGFPRWTIPFTVGNIYGAAILDDGDVVWSEYGDTLFRATRDGELVFQVPLETVPGLGPTGWSSAPTVADDGTLYLVSWLFYEGPSALYAVSPDGTPKWAMLLDEHRGADRPAIDADGNIVVALVRKPSDYHQDPTAVAIGKLIKLTPDGSILWSTEFDGGSAPAISPSIAPDESIRLGRRSAEPAPNFLAFDASGAALPFPFTVYKIVASTPVIDFAGRTYVCHAGGVVTYTPSGEVLWQLDAPDLVQLHMWTQAALSADGVLIGADDNGTLHGIKDGKVLWNLPLSTGVGDVSIGPDGTFFVSTSDSEVVAVR